MHIIQTEFKQRAYDGMWEKLGRVLDHDNRYVYKNEDGKNTTFIPTKWITLGVFDFVGELE